MTDNTSPMTDDPAMIEKDIRRTQEDMSRTVDKIGDQLTFRNLFNALLDKADENDVDARYLVEGARKNPIALGLIAAGAIWLVSDKNSKFPSMPGRDKSPDEDELDLTGYDVHHRDYVSHMSALEIRDGEDSAAYQRRRDDARAAFLMCERTTDEDDHSFRQRLDSMTETFREKRRAWTDSASHAASSAGSSTKRTARRAASAGQDAYYGNPLVGGALAAALGAALGSSVPISRKEQETLGDVGHKARDMASETTEQLASKAREKKDELIDKADQTIEGSGREPQPAGGGSDFGGQPSHADAPFIIGDRER